VKRYALLLVGYPILGLFGFAASCGRRSVEHAEHLYVVGLPQQVPVVAKQTHTVVQKKSSSRTVYEVSIEAGGRTHRLTVTSQDWYATPVWSLTTWYVDPATGEGIAEVERRYRTDRNGIRVLMGFGFVLAIIFSRGWWQGLPGGASEGRVRKGGPPPPPIDQFYLPKPERESTAQWERWLRIKYPSLGYLLGLTFGGAAVLALPALAVGFHEISMLLGLHAIFGAWTVLLASGRGHRRDRLLWRRGEERHAVARVARRDGNIRRYDVAFEFGGTVYTLRQRIPIEGEALTTRKDHVVVLVDPLRPTRAMVVPREAV
jgi:hypothetical protein